MGKIKLKKTILLASEVLNCIYVKSGLKVFISFLGHILEKSKIKAA